MSITMEKVTVMKAIMKASGVEDEKLFDIFEEIEKYSEIVKEIDASRSFLKIFARKLDEKKIQKKDIEMLGVCADMLSMGMKREAFNEKESLTQLEQLIVEEVKRISELLQLSLDMFIKHSSFKA